MPAPSAPPPPAAPFDPAATASDVLACFRLILGRNPSPEEMAGHMANVGRPLADVVATYVGSAEFSRRKLLQRPQGEIRLVSLPGYRIYTPVTDEAVGRHVADGVYDPHIAAVLRRVLRPGMGMLDLGANIGVFALLAASLVGPNGSVLAMEPNPANARLLEASRLANEFSHLTVCQAAASRSAGVLALHCAGSNGTATEAAEQALLTAQTVAALRVDDLVGAGQPVDLIKIDVEGAEHLALTGAEAVLRRCRPTIVSEFSPGLLRHVSGIDGASYLRFLQAFGYQLAVLGRDGSFVPGASVDAIVAAYGAAGTDHIDIVAVP